MVTHGLSCRVGLCLRDRLWRHYSLSLSKSCKIVGGQRYTKGLNEKQITSLLKVSCQRPREQETNILQTIHETDYEYNPYAKEFGISIDSKLVSVKARVYTFFIPVFSSSMFMIHVIGVKLILCGLTLRGQWTFTISRVCTIALT
uniref:Uncharacterized protein n=1 Tax=Glycine max TaxID=3847 RepID=K7LDF7_SOYBN